MASKKWKDSNYNYKIKVSESTVAQLKKGTKASNIAKANAPGASAEFREAVARFYGRSSLRPVSSSPSKRVPHSVAPAGPSSKPRVRPAGETASSGTRNQKPRESASGKVYYPSGGNPKPTPKDMAAGKKAAAANNRRNAASMAASLKESRKSPKPSKSELSAAAKKRILARKRVAVATGRNSRPTSGVYRRNPGSV